MLTDPPAELQDNNVLLFVYNQISIYFWTGQYLCYTIEALSNVVGHEV